MIAGGGGGCGAGGGAGCDDGPPAAIPNEEYKAKARK